MVIHLYIKTHNKTGLKYFGKTTNKDPLKYKGSGKYWKRHLAKYGNDVITEILGSYTDVAECTAASLQFSKLHNITASNEWANLQDENGLDGAPVGHTPHVFTDQERLKISIASLQKWKDPEYREKIQNIHKERFKKNPELAKQIGQKIVANQKANNTYEAAKEARKNGLLRYLNSLTDEEKENKKLIFKAPKSEEHKAKISQANKGKQKSAEHIRKTAITKQKIKAVFIDHKGEKYILHSDFLKRYGLSRKFFLTLDRPISNPAILKRLEIDIDYGLNKTKTELGFRFEY